MAKSTAKDSYSAYREIMKELKAGEFNPCYLLMGEEPYYVDKIASYIIENALTEEEKAFNQMVLYAQDVTPALIVDNARRYPVMAPRQVIIVKEAQQLKGTELLASYFKAMNPSCVLVLCFMGKSVDKRTELWKAAQKHCRILESVPLRDYEIPDWITAYLKEKGTNIEPQAARLLADFLGTDLQRIVMEIEKLFILMPQGTWAVTTEMVEKSVGVNRDFSPFALFNHIAAGNFAKVQPIVEYFADNEKKYPLVMLISLFYTQLSRILKLHSYQLENPGITSDKLRELMGLNYYFFQETMKAARFFTFPRTVRAMNLLCAYDSMYKSSDRGEAGDGELLMEMICKMMA
ncbi:MAG TPA: DNA polymerase III subunit delta [Bacteroidales bacterium]|nr:DNA polymerase III subunit delta [Bacteroidales bacterium]HRW95029.1 DNA polymerase III subunit delta [Bacteroidales bacterium]